MDAFVDFFVQWGYWGLFVGSFIAGSVIPLSSEAILVVCVGPLHLDPWICLWAALAGNVAGGMTCYWMGHLGKMEWIEKYCFRFASRQCLGHCGGNECGKMAQIRRCDLGNGIRDPILVISPCSKSHCHGETC